MEYDKRNPAFPSDFLSPTEKASKEYSLRWARAIDGVGLTGAENGLYPGMGGENSSSTKYELWRAYARGNQSIDKYKPILGIRNKTRRDPQANSYRTLNFEILDIASKYVNVLIGKLLKQNNDIGINAVDKRAQDDRRKKKMEMQEYIVNKEFLKSVSKVTGIEFQTPVHDDVMPPPETLGEVNLYDQMFYKEDYCMVVQDLLKLMNEQDNYTELLSEVARDLVEIGVAVTKTYRVQNKILRRRCVPERMIISSSQKSTCDDLKYVGEYWDLTIGQLKEIAGDQLSEKDYQKIAEQTTGASYDNFNVPKYYSENLCYPWDNTKITVGDFTWWSPDWETYQVGANRFGNVAVSKKEFDWWKNLEEKGVTEEKFNKANESKVVRYALDNQYGCMWVLKTDFVINYGKCKDMLRNESSIGKTEGPFTIYKSKKCIMESIIPTLDNIQIQWLQYQHHAAKSVPAGPAIEFSALQDISIEGAGGKKITPKEALQIYFETGILLWRRRDAHGNMSNFKPIEQLAGGISNAMEKHFNFMIQDINLLRDQIGLNELTDASTPNSEMGKAVATMAAGATDDALRGLHFGFDWINLGTHKKTVMHISGMAATGLAPQYTEALGLQAMAIVALLSDLTIHELGVYPMKQPTEQMKAWINEYCKAGITNGTLYEEEAFEIQTEPNIWRSIRLLKMYRRQKQEQKAKEMQAQYQGEQEKNIASAQATAEAQKGAIDYEMEKKKELVWETEAAKQETEAKSIANQAFLIRIQAKLDAKQELTMEEERRLTELMKIREQGKNQVMVAKVKPKPTAGKK
jgi:hypothetical protein